ncbi:hypothetical protein ACWIG4_27160 [Streptomyces sp. NPDC002248]
MNTPAHTAPWNDPPERKKPLRRRRAEKLARRAAHWGDRLAEAREQGPDMEAAVAFDRLRGEIDKLPAAARDAAYDHVVRALDTLRETHAQ